MLTHWSQLVPNKSTTSGEDIKQHRRQSGSPVSLAVKPQALVYDILPSRRKVPESGDRSEPSGKALGW